MIDLSEIAGVSLSLTDDCRLEFAEPMSSIVESVRQIDSLAAVWMDPTVHGAADIYRVYWNAYRRSHQSLFTEYGLNHAYVVLFPGVHGREYNKTQGHYHPPVVGTQLSTPEIYKVLHGHGYFLLQRSSPPFNAVDDIVLVEARTGDVFHVPPNYGHLTVNLDDTPLVFEAFLTADLTPITDPYRERQGGTHYVVSHENRHEVVPNAHYDILPGLRRLGSSDLEPWEARWGEILYPWFVNHPQEFLFLVDPTRFDPAWTP